MERLEAKAVFDAYVEAGGNLVDTADVYAGGRSEEMLGAMIADRGLRDSLVVPPSLAFPRWPPCRGQLRQACACRTGRSLRRLGTYYIDLYWVHVWDLVKPAEELLETMAGLVRAGKIRNWSGFRGTRIVSCR